ncbi:MAG: hypothetical protein AAF629_34250 [Chloroflexota bacterium]
MRFLKSILPVFMLSISFWGCAIDDPQAFSESLENFAVAILTPTPLPPAIPNEEVSPKATPLPPPTAIETDRPVRLRRITQGECCTAAYWASNTEIRFIDQNPESGQIGIWSIDIKEDDLTPQFVTERLGITSNNGRYLAYPDRDTGVAIIEDFVDEVSWTLNLNESPVNFMPDNEHILWIEIDRDKPRETQSPVYWMAKVDGSERRSILSIGRSSPLDWLDDTTLLLSILQDDESASQFAIQTSLIASFSLTDGNVTPFFSAERPRGIDLNPGKNALVYMTVLADDPANNGIWYVDLTQVPSSPQKLPFSGTHQKGKRRQSRHRCALSSGWIVPFQGSTAIPIHRWMRSPPHCRRG